MHLLQACADGCVRQITIHPSVPSATACFPHSGVTSGTCCRASSHLQLMIDITAWRGPGVAFSVSSAFAVQLGKKQRRTLNSTPAWLHGRPCGCDRGTCKARAEALRQRTNRAKRPVAISSWSNVVGGDARTPPHAAARTQKLACWITIAPPGCSRCDGLFLAAGNGRMARRSVRCGDHGSGSPQLPIGPNWRALPACHAPFRRVRRVTTRCS